MINLLLCIHLDMKFALLIFGLSLIGFNMAYASLGDVSTTEIESESDSGKIIVGKQVMIAADVINNQNTMQSFAYITQIKDEHGVVVSLSWLVGSLSPNQSLSPAQSWTPMNAGTYTIEVFVWKSIDNPDALSPPLSMELYVIEEQS